MRSPRTSRNRAAVAVKLPQRFGQAVGISRELHSGSVRQVFALAPQKRHARFEHTERKKPQRQLDGHICEEDREKQEIANGSKHRLLGRSCVEKIVYIVGLKPGAAREKRSYGSRFRSAAFAVFFSGESVTHNAPQRA